MKIGQWSAGKLLVGVAVVLVLLTPGYGLFFTLWSGGPSSSTAQLNPSTILEREQREAEVQPVASSIQIAGGRREIPLPPPKLGLKRYARGGAAEEGAGYNKRGVSSRELDAAWGRQNQEAIALRHLLEARNKILGEQKGNKGLPPPTAEAPTTRRAQDEHVVTTAPVAPTTTAAPTVTSSPPPPPTDTPDSLAPDTNTTLPTRKPNASPWGQRMWYNRWNWDRPPVNITPEQLHIVQSIQRDLTHAEEQRKAGRFNGSQFSGVLFVADGKGSCDQVDIPAPFGEDRLPSPLFSIIRTHAAKHLKNFTILHVGYEDNCVYWPAIRFGRNSEAAQMVYKLTERFPMLFWVHWNPTLVSEPDGVIGKRVVPIPHFHAVQRGNSARSPPWRERKKGILWRGTTTGWERPYNQSSRWKTVNAFQQAQESWEEELRQKRRRHEEILKEESDKRMEKIAEMTGDNSSLSGTLPPLTWAPSAAPAPKFWANVKFYSRSQHVFQDVVPDSFMGGIVEKENQGSTAVGVDIDGNGNSWEGLRWKIQGGSAIIKIRSKKFIQWYYPLLVHGLHLLNVDVDTEDVVAVAKNLLQDDELGERLSVNAGTFGEDHLSIIAAAEYAGETIKNIWQYDSAEYEKKDWRITMKFDPEKHFVAQPTPVPTPLPIEEMRQQLTKQREAWFKKRSRPEGGQNAWLDEGDRN